MKIFKLNISLFFSTFLVVFVVLLSSCDKNGNDDPPVDPNDSIPNDSLPNDTLLEITQPVSAIAVGKDNTKWIGTSAGLYKSVSGGYLLVDSIAVNTLLFEEESDLFWVGTTQGIIKLTLSGSEIVSNSNIPTANVSHQNIRASYLEGSTNKWFGTNMGITLNHGDYWKNDSFRINVLNNIFPMELEAMEVNSISVWEGDYYFATNGGYIYRATGYDASVDAFSGATQWVPPYNGYNLTSNMNVVFVDSEGIQWMGGESGIQLHRGHDPKNMEDFAFFKDELVSPLILTIAEAPDGKVWVGTDKGISIYDGTTWSTHTENLPDLYISSIAFDKTDGSAWVGTKKGLVIVK